MYEMVGRMGEQKVQGPFSNKGPWTTEAYRPRSPLPKHTLQRYAQGRGSFLPPPSLSIRRISSYGRGIEKGEGGRSDPPPLGVACRPRPGGRHQSRSLHSLTSSVPSPSRGRVHSPLGSISWGEYEVSEWRERDCNQTKDPVISPTGSLVWFPLHVHLVTGVPYL